MVLRKCFLYEICPYQYLDCFQKIREKEVNDRMSIFKDGACIKVVLKTCVCFLSWYIFSISKLASYYTFFQKD